MTRKLKIMATVAFAAVAIFVYAQDGLPKAKILKKYKAKAIEMDRINEDGVFKMQSAKTDKWGMYQWMYEGTKCTKLIPMDYDSLKYFPFNGYYTAVYNNGKVGFYLSKWSYDDLAKQSVECLYDDYARYTISNKPYLAVKKGDEWGWVDWLHGTEQGEFKYKNHKDLPRPDFEQKVMFE